MAESPDTAEPLGMLGLDEIARSRVRPSIASACPPAASCARGGATARTPPLDAASTSRSLRCGALRCLASPSLAQRVTRPTCPAPLMPAPSASKLCPGVPPHDRPLSRRFEPADKQRSVSQRPRWPTTALPCSLPTALAPPRSFHHRGEFHHLAGRRAPSPSWSRSTALTAATPVAVTRHWRGCWCGGSVRPVPPLWSRLRAWWRESTPTARPRFAGAQRAERSRWRAPCRRRRQQARRRRAGVVAAATAAAARCRRPTPR